MHGRSVLARCRVAAIAPALFGSLVLVAMIRKAPEPQDSPAYSIGYNLSDFMKEGFVAISALLGSLGSFFSGSTTVSDLTFGVVQLTAARGIGANEMAMLALQVCVRGAVTCFVCTNVSQFKLVSHCYRPIGAVACTCARIESLFC